MEEEKIQKLRQMDRALEQQAGMIDPKRYIGDIVMKNQIELLEQQVRELNVYSVPSEPLARSN